MVAEVARADVLWSPDGAAVAITDHAGSSDATAWIVRISSPKERESLEAAFNRAFGRPEEIYRHGHRYFRALSWQSPTSLLFEVQAHDAGPEWYRAQFSYTAGVVRPVETP